MGWGVNQDLHDLAWGGGFPPPTTSLFWPSDCHNSAASRSSQQTVARPGDIFFIPADSDSAAASDVEPCWHVRVR